MSPINSYRAVEQRRKLKTIANHFDCTDLNLLEDVLREKGYKISEKGFVTFYIDKNWKNYFDGKREINPIISAIDHEAFGRRGSKGFWRGIEKEGFAFDRHRNAIRESIPKN
jgi:hypothetical protein